MQVNEEKENKLFNRKEVEITLDSKGGTVSRKAALEELKKKFSGEIVIEKIDQKFGRNFVTVKARVYPSKEDAVKYEPQWRFDRGQPKAAKK
jgi:ribosomal protein S24E